MQGGARLQLHRPERRDIVFETNAQWEGNACCYQCVFQDGDLYRMYYHGSHYCVSGPPAQVLEEHPGVLCYAESDDGIHWRRPELGLFEFAGSKANNIILTPEAVVQVGGVRPLAGTPVRLRFALRDADLYAFQFVPYEPEPQRPDLTQFQVGR